MEESHRPLASRPSDHVATGQRPERAREPTDGKPSLYGRCATVTTVGHTGWTGTTIWLDRAQNLFVVFLTNRSLAPRARNSLTILRGIRSSLSDLVIRLTGR